MRLSFKPAFVVVVAAAFLGGCAADNRASYVEPTLTDQESATVSGGWGYYVTEVDGCRVDSANVRLLNYGGNSVKVEPGHHEFGATNGTINGTGNGGSVTNNQKWQFRYTVLAGHHYALGPTSLFNTSLTITDKQTKVTEAVNVSSDAAPPTGTAAKFPGD